MDFSGKEKWWQHFKDHAENHILYETPENIQNIPTSFKDSWEDSTGTVKFDFHFRDISHHIKEMKSKSDYNRENRSKEYLFNSKTKLEIILPVISINSIWLLICRSAKSITATEFVGLG